MAYTKEQKERMFRKLKAMKYGTIVNLNKNDVCPIKCELCKYEWAICFKAVETGTVIVSTIGNGDDFMSRFFVDKIEKAIDEWDLVTKQYFIDLAKKQGLEP